MAMGTSRSSSAGVLVRCGAVFGGRLLYLLALLLQTAASLQCGFAFCLRGADVANGLFHGAVGLFEYVASLGTGLADYVVAAFFQLVAQGLVFVYDFGQEGVAGIEALALFGHGLFV